MPGLRLSYERHRQWKKLPLEKRLQRWVNRVSKNSLGKFPMPRGMFLPARLVELLGLPSNRVLLYGDGSLWHGSREESIARANNT